MDETNIKWRFAVVGNIVMQHPDEDGILRFGTKVFAGGTKVYIFNEWIFGENNNEVCIIARNRFGNYCIDSVSIHDIENLRCQRVYKPTVLRIVDHYVSQEGWTAWNQAPSDRREAEEFVKRCNTSMDRSDGSVN